ncbi:isoprenoid biosynthesis glyoxalase ElbB [Geoalkalibacter subterraneus]|uniref:Isoprenylcysteine carboxyl methyltransferase n=1 Tax=Geoalkalibacter subterraneus TaxID=483547 RepID=A0A0B5FEF7_9BACT|nr:isoprenoid biosynthesis glyoxalase ElbB [Geoalkalibacter subterraneus]AJF05693.1 isoprenylcysteine carboxyl methyltransferase [Geoalkalibacter subterraneus]
MAKKIGVVLAGCGVYDGSEIHEAVITMLALDRAGAEIICMAPDMEQMHVVNHLTGEPAEGETRNVLVEAARIARGNIKNIADIKADQLDGLFMPGGFGVAKNLCDFAVKGPDCTVHPEVSRLVKEIVAAKKPLAAVCIAPALISKVLGDQKPKLTIGNDADVAGGMEKMGAQHVQCPVNEFVVDEENKIISTPAYMLAGRISEAAEGIEKTVQALLKMA